jgi:hypothetical protein
VGRKILAGVNTVSNWTSVAGALEGMLIALGSTLDRTAIMGLSGHAFRLAIRTTADGIADGESSVCFDYARALQLYTNLGCKLEQVAARPGDPDYARRREEAIKRIRRSIDHNVPAIVYDLQLPEFGLVKGYDDRAGLFYVSTTVSAQYGEVLPLAQWPTPEHLRWIQALLTVGRSRVDRRRAERDALSFAVQYAEHGDPLGPDDTVHGLAAYERWLDGYAAPDRLIRYGNARCIQVVQAARKDAARFLRDIARDYAAGIGAALKQAASSYDDEVLAFSRLASLFPYPSGGDVSNPGALATGAASLRQALICERAAVAHLKTALSQS